MGFIEYIQEKKAERLSQKSKDTNEGTNKLSEDSRQINKNFESKTTFNKPKISSDIEDLVGVSVDNENGTPEEPNNNPPLNMDLINASIDTEGQYLRAIEDFKEYNTFTLYNTYRVEKNMDKMSAEEFFDYIFENTEDDAFMTSIAKFNLFLSKIESLERELSAIIYKEKMKQKLQQSRVKNNKLETQKDKDDKEKKNPPSDNDKLNFDLDARLYCFTCEHDMDGFIIITPPCGNGKEMTTKTMIETLKQDNIITNIDKNLMLKIISQKPYMKFIKIAEGTAAIDGIDGKIINKFEDTNNPNLKTNKYGRIDHKNLGKFHSVEQDQKLCEIIHPIPGHDGITVTGKILPAHKAKDPILPRGEGFYINEDKTFVCSKTDGYLTVEGNELVIRPKMEINNDVDISTGNIHFNGDLIVHGDVKSGFNIKIGGNLRVNGVIESADIHAGGNIQVDRGINGGNAATVEADGYIKTSFLENCTVKAKNGIYAESILNSTICSDTFVDVQNGKGAIIGGVVMAKTTVQAKTIGVSAGNKTTISLGHSFITNERVFTLSKKIELNSFILENAEKDLAYLESFEELPPAKQAHYILLKKKRNLYIKTLKADINEFNKLNKNKPDLKNCLLKADVAYPPLDISIGSAEKHFSEPIHKCFLKYNFDEMKIYQLNI